MANHHFGKLADVWKHLALDETLAVARPKRYAETHAGSAAYPLVGDAERRYGVLGYLEPPRSSRLASAAFTRVVSDFASRRPGLYPGSALQAMTLLGNDTAYLLCDLNPVSAKDLRSWASRLGLVNCEVVERDGMTTVRDWLSEPAPMVVHIDPFDPFAHAEGAPSAVQLAVEVAEAGHLLVYWYGYSTPSDRAWAVEEIRAGTRADLWWGDFMVTATDGAVRHDGDLGEGTKAGTGSGVVLANASEALVAACHGLAVEFARAYAGRDLPDGGPGRVDLVMGKSA